MKNFYVAITRHFQVIDILLKDLPWVVSRFGLPVQKYRRAVVGTLDLIVQRILSLTSSFRGQLIKCFMTLQPTTLIFFVEKMREAFAASLIAFQIFSTKNIDISYIKVGNFNEIVTSKVIKF